LIRAWTYGRLLLTFRGTARGDQHYQYQKQKHSQFHHQPVQFSIQERVDNEITEPLQKSSLKKYPGNFHLDGLEDLRSISKIVPNSKQPGTTGSRLRVWHKKLPRKFPVKMC
jgi:hypothetical protein